MGKTGKDTWTHPKAEVLSSNRSLLRDAAMSMKIRFAVLGVREARVGGRF